MSARNFFLAIMLFLMSSLSLKATNPYDKSVKLAEYLAFKEVWPHVRNKAELWQYFAHGGAGEILDKEMRSSELFLNEETLIIERQFGISSYSFKCFVNLRRGDAKVIAYGRDSRFLIWSNIDQMVTELLRSDAAFGEDTYAKLLDILLPWRIVVYQVEDGELVRLPRKFGGKRTEMPCNLLKADAIPREEAAFVLCERLEDDCYLHGVVIPVRRRRPSGKIRFHFLGAKRPTENFEIGNLGAVTGPTVLFDFKEGSGVW